MMTNLTKKILISLFALIAIGLIGASVAITWIMNSTTLLANIKKTIQQRTGYQVTSSGPISFSLYPFLALQIKELSIIKPNDTDPTLTFKNMTVSTPWKFQQITNNKWDVSLHANELIIQRFRATNVKTEITIGLDNLIMKNLQADCYQGTLTGNASFTKTPVLGLKWQFKLTNIELSQLLGDLRGNDGIITLTSLANLRFIGHTQNLDKVTLQKAMLATLEFDMQQGNLQGLDLNYFIDKGMALLTKEKSERAMTSGTPFQQFGGTIYIADNIAAIDNLLLQTDTFSARIAGELSLADRKLDASIEVKPVKNPRLVIPLILNGSINKPTVSLDSILIHSILTKDEMDKVKAKVVKEIEKIPERANKLLNSFLGK